MKRVILLVLSTFLWAKLAGAALTDVGGIGTHDEDMAGGTSAVLTTTATLEAGNLGVCLLAFDENTTNTVDGDKAFVTSLIDSNGTVWVEAGERCEMRTSALLDGACVGIFYVYNPTQLTSGSSITTTFSTGTNAVALTCHEFTGVRGIRKTGTNAQLAHTAADPFTMGSTFGASSRDHLVIRAQAHETNVAGWTPDSDYSGFTEATYDSGVADTSMAIRGDYDINDSGFITSQDDPTYTAADGYGFLILLFDNVMPSPFLNFPRP